MTAAAAALSAAELMGAGVVLAGLAVATSGARLRARAGARALEPSPVASAEP